MLQKACAPDYAQQHTTASRACRQPPHQALLGTTLRSYLLPLPFDKLRGPKDIRCNGEALFASILQYTISKIARPVASATPHLVFFNPRQKHLQPKNTANTPRTSFYNSQTKYCIVRKLMCSTLLAFCSNPIPYYSTRIPLSSRELIFCSNMLALCSPRIPLSISLLSKNQ